MTLTSLITKSQVWLCDVRSWGNHYRLAFGLSWNQERVAVEPAKLPLKAALKITLTNRPFMFLVGTVFFYGIGQYFAVAFGV